MTNIFKVNPESIMTQVLNLPVPYENAMRFLSGLMYYEDHSKYGWKYSDKVCKDVGFISQKSNVYNYMSPYLKLKVVQKRIFKEPDNRGRIPKKGKVQYRLTPGNKSFMLLKCIVRNYCHREKSYDLMIYFLNSDYAKRMGEIIPSLAKAKGREDETKKMVDLVILEARERELADELRLIRNEIKKYKEVKA